MAIRISSVGAPSGQHRYSHSCGGGAARAEGEFTLETDGRGIEPLFYKQWEEHHLYWLADCCFMAFTIGSKINITFTYQQFVVYDLLTHLFPLVLSFVASYLLNIWPIQPLALLMFVFCVLAILTKKQMELSRGRMFLCNFMVWPCNVRTISYDEHIFSALHYICCFT